MNYYKSRETASRLIRKFGKLALVRRDLDGSAWEPGVDGSSNHPCYVVILEYHTLERNSTLIGTTDKKVLISTENLDIVPRASDLLVVDNKEYEIIRLSPIQPADVVIFYEAQVRF
jgi:hypothetical protein